MIPTDPLRFFFTANTLEIRTGMYQPRSASNSEQLNGLFWHFQAPNINAFEVQIIRSHVCHIKSLLTRDLKIKITTCEITAIFSQRECWHDNQLINIRRKRNVKTICFASPITDRQFVCETYRALHREIKKAPRSSGSTHYVVASNIMSETRMLMLPALKLLLKRTHIQVFISFPLPSIRTRKKPVAIFHAEGTRSRSLL